MPLLDCSILYPLMPLPAKLQVKLICFTPGVATRFVGAGNGPEERIYKPKSSRWLNWDSNRIVIGAIDGDEIAVTVPLHFYQSLKRRHL